MSETPKTLTVEYVASMRNAAPFAGAACDDVVLICDSHESLRAEVERLAQIEALRERIAFEIADLETLLPINSGLGLDNKRRLQLLIDIAALLPVRGAGADPPTGETR